MSKRGPTRLGNFVCFKRFLKDSDANSCDFLDYCIDVGGVCRVHAVTPVAGMRVIIAVVRIGAKMRSLRANRQVSRGWLYPYRNKMNKNVHQIVFADPGAAPPTGYAKEAMGSVRRAFPGCQIRVWSLEEAKGFIDEHFSPDVLRAFDCLRPYAYKADLFKLCVLHSVGGWCVDVGMTMLQSPLRARFAWSGNPPKFVLFRSTSKADAPWNCSLGLLYAEPGHEVFTTAISEVIDNCKHQRYGVSPLSPMMSPFGRALAIHNVHEGVKIGTVVDVKGREYSRAHQLPPLGLIVARKPLGGPGDVTHIGLHGGNNYWKMWKQREIFGTW